MAKHTPGPWTVEADNEILEVFSYATGDPICSVSAAWFPEVRAIADADARLIAAAPDLVEAVRDIVADCKWHINPGLYELAVAALAKAESRDAL